MTAKTAQAIPSVRLEALATAAGVSINTLRSLMAGGVLPPHDTIQIVHGMSANVWKISTIRAWRPDVADRCEAILQALEKTPLAA